MKRVIAANVLVLCLLLIIIEMAGQMYSLWTNGAFLPELYARRRRQVEEQTTVFERHPYLVARPKRSARATRDKASVTTTEIHTRVTSASPARPDAIRVALVGGSTTFGTRVTDEDSWPWQLQTRLGDRYDVINYGVPGYTTAEAIIQMALIVPEQKPSIVVFYEGWNDIRNYHWPGLASDYYAHGMTQFDTLLPVAADRTPFWGRMAQYSFMASLAGRLLDTRVGAQSLVFDKPDPEVDRIYQRNLNTLKVLARNLGMTALFVPQVLNDSNYSSKGVARSWTPYIEDAALPGLMRSFNGLMATVCAKGDDECQFVGEVQTMTWDGNDFVDEGHFSRRGGEKLATIVETRIRRIAATSDTAHSGIHTE